MFSPINLPTKYATGWRVSGVGGGRDPVFGQTQDSLSRELVFLSILHLSACYMALWRPQRTDCATSLEGKSRMWKNDFPNKTTTKSNTKELLFQIEKFQVPLGFKQNLPPSSPNQPKVCFRPRLTLSPLCSVWRGGAAIKGDRGVLQGVGDTGSTELRFPKLGWKFAFQGILSGDGAEDGWKICGLSWGFISLSHTLLLIALGPLPRSACAKDRQHTLDLVVPQGYKKCSGTEEKQCTHIITTRFLGLPVLLKERDLSSGSLCTTGYMQIITPTCPPPKVGLHCGYRKFVRILWNCKLGLPAAGDTYSQRMY